MIMRIFTIAPLLALPILIYHFVAVSASASGMDAALGAVLFSMPMISGGAWSFTTSDAILLFGVAMLFIEIVKATSSRSSSLANHGLSTAIFVVSLIEFLLLKSFATSTFFFLMMFALMDLIGGSMVTIVSARRDFGVGDGLAR